jgi:hypothetical protein
VQRYDSQGLPRIFGRRFTTALPVAPWHLGKNLLELRRCSLACFPASLNAYARAGADDSTARSELLSSGLRQPLEQSDRLAGRVDGCARS